MIPDLDDMLSDFGEAIAVALKALDDTGVVQVNKVRVDGPFKITTNISARIGLLEGLEPGRMPGPPPPAEPLIEVVDDRRGLRAIALLPGIRKEDVKVYPLKGSLRIEVSKDGTVHRKDVPCDAPPSSIVVRSKTLNNSVVEIRFSRKKEVRP